jgi:hypothetical protein
MVDRFREQSYFEVCVMNGKRAGFTLIEFAIANLITMIILGATFTLMNNIFHANNGMGDVMATQQNVRVASNTIARDVTMAGTGLPSSSVAVPNGTNSTPIIRPGMAGFASPARNLATPNNTIPMLSPGDGSGPTVSTSTDALTIFTVNQETPTWTVSTIAVFSDRYEVTFTQNVSAGSMQLVPGDLLLFNNNNGSVLACVSDISTVTNTKAFFRTADLMGINQPEAANGNIGSLKNPASNPAVFPPTTAIRVNVINYFLSTTNALHPRLMRAVNTSAAQIISEDIENLQFSFDLFDFQTNAETSNQASTASPNQIRSVLISLTGRSPDKLERTNSYYRLSLVSKINVRNATFRNRYTGS